MCSFHKKYDSTKSTTYEPDGKTFKLVYGDGTVKGFWSYEDLNWGGKN